jgi:hypothetical protein
MQSNLRKPLAAALLLSSAALFAQPAFARDFVVVQAPAVTPATVYVRDAQPHPEAWRPGGRHRGEWRRDERPPTIGELTPVPGDRIGERRRTLVSARFTDRFSGVDPSSVRLRIDGRDVTAFARLFDDEIRVRENLFPGRHVAEVIVRDRAGNTARRSWQFDVIDGREDRYGQGYGFGEGYGRRGWER